jgi:hypothetical protein
MSEWLDTSTDYSVQSSVQYVRFLLADPMRFSPSNAKPGMTTTEVVTVLVSENEAISAVFSFVYRHPPLLQQRLTLSSDECEILGKAMVLRKKSCLPFWEALMLSCFGEPRDFRRLLREAAFHQSHKASLQRITRHEVLAGHLGHLINSQPIGHHLSFSSRIELAGIGLGQLPLMDFHCPESAENDRLVSEVCGQLFRHAALIFSSGESYHALGLEPMDEQAFPVFLTRSLLFAPIVDARYVAHQLLEGACALRLSSSTEKPNQPRLKFILENDHKD